MSTRVRVLVFAGLLSASGVLARADEKDDKDPIKEKLFAAKVTYDKDMAEFRKAAEDWFDKREEAARKAGDKKLVDQIKADRKSFDEVDALPKTTPAAIAQKPPAARKALEAAYTDAVKAYTKAKKDDLAAAVEKELSAFRKEPDEKFKTALLGTWKVSVGDYKGEWLFKEDGAVDSSTSGAGSGKWALDKAKGAVVVTWNGGAKDKFDLPINPKGTIGSQVGRQNLKLEAVKIK